MRCHVECGSDQGTKQGIYASCKIETKADPVVGWLEGYSEFMLAVKKKQKQALWLDG